MFYYAMRLSAQSRGKIYWCLVFINFFYKKVNIFVFHDMINKRGYISKILSKAVFIQIYRLIMVLFSVI